MLPVAANRWLSPVFLRLVFNILRPSDTKSSALKKVFSKKGYLCKHTKITQTYGCGVVDKASCGY